MSELYRNRSLLACVIYLVIASLSASATHTNEDRLLVYRGIIREDATKGADVELDKPLYVRKRTGISNGEICGYTVYKSGSFFPFRTVLLEPMTGSAKIILTEERQLDFEKQKEFVFEIAAHDCVSGAHATREKVIINVEDVNDHSPKWKSSSYYAEVEENKIDGHIVHLEAVDGDGSEAFSKICHYLVVTPNVPFSVDDDGYMVNTEPLDSTRQSQYVVEVVAEDCAGLTSNAIVVHIKVTPMCRPHWTDVPESIAFTTRSGGHKRLLPNARLDLCGLTSCNLSRITTTIKLTPSSGDMECDRDAASIRAQRKLCGAAEDTVYLLPDTGSHQAVEEGPDSGVFYFDGKASAVHIPTSKLQADFGKQFTLSTWMKHSGNEEMIMAWDKENILCLADGEAMNRRRLSLSIHNCHLILLLRREAVTEADSSNFRPTEWRWKLDQVCDSTWHHYAISVDYPEIRLYIDGQQFVESKHNPEITDDWPLHKTKTKHFTKLVVGACWQGKKHRLGHFLRGSLAGLTVVQNSTETDQLIHCINSCSEKLDFTALDDIDISTSVSLNSAKTAAVINGATRDVIQTLLHRVTYVNARMFPTLGRRLLSLETLATCSDGTQTAFEMATTAIMVMELDRKIIEINSTSQLLVDEEELTRGLKPFANITVQHIPKSPESSVSLVRDTVDSCLVQVNSPPLNLEVEHLMYPQNLVHDLGLRVDLNEDGIVISGTDKLASFESVLQDILYVNAEPKNITARSFIVSCTEENGHYISNKHQVSLEMIHYQPTVHAAAAVENKLFHQEINKLIIDKIPNYDGKLNSKQVGVGMAVAILACVSLMVVLAVVGALRMRNVKEPIRDVNIEDKQEMEWDNSELTITVNPMENQLMMFSQTTDVSTPGDFMESEDEASGHDNDGEASDEEEEVVEGEGEAEGTDKLKTRELEWDDSTLTY